MRKERAVCTVSAFVADRGATEAASTFLIYHPAYRAVLFVIGTTHASSPRYGRGYVRMLLLRIACSFCLLYGQFVIGHLVSFAINLIFAEIFLHSTINSSLVISISKRK